MRFLIYVCIWAIIFGSYIATLIVLITHRKYTEALILIAIWGFTIMTGLYSLRYKAKWYTHSSNSLDRPKLNELGFTSSIVVIRTLFIILIIVAIIITIIIILRVIF